MIVFSKEWFKKYNKQLCWLANSFIGDWIFSISKMGHDKKKYGKITEMHPNAITHKQRLLYDFEKKEFEQEYTSQFFSRNEYALRLQKIFYPIWFTFHCWDMLIANRFKPAWNLGFDTLTVYPDAGTGNTTVDGFLNRWSVGGESFSTIRSSIGTEARPTDTQSDFLKLDSASDANLFNQLNRCIFTVDASTLPDECTISNSVFSVYGTGKNNGLSLSAAHSEIELVTSNPAANNNLATSDYNIAVYGSTALATAISYSSYNTGGYNHLTMNSSGIAIVSKTGITKLGLRLGVDLDNGTPAYSSNSESSYQGYYADNGSNKPKLVVTYTTGPTHTITCETGSFTLTGIDTGLIGTYKIVCETGSFILTGIDAIIARGLFIICETGSFALTGVDTGIRAGYKIVCETGTFVLTGVDTGIRAGYKVVCETGSFIINWIDIKIRSIRNRTKVSTSFTNRAKESTTLTNKAKNSTSFTNREK